MTALELVQGDLPEEELINPLTGEEIPRDNVAALATALEEITAQDGDIYRYKRGLKDALAKHAKGEKRTERVLFPGGAVRIEHPQPSWSQAILREAYEMPGAKSVLKIATVAVKLREWKKIEDATGQGPMVTLRNKIAEAKQEPTAAPAVKVERS